MPPATAPSRRLSSRDRRLRRALALLPVLAVLPLAIPPAADAKTVRSNNVYAYGAGSVSCYVVKLFDGVSSQGIECGSQALPHKETDGYVELHRTGRARIGERGDYAGYSGGRRKLRVGDTWRPGHSAKGIVCKLRSSGLRCTNHSGHGFTITPDVFRRF